MKFFLTVAMGVLLSSSLSKACGQEFFKPFVEEKNTKQEKTKDVVSQKLFTTACGAMYIDFINNNSSNRKKNTQTK